MNTIEYFAAHETLADMDTTSPDKFKAMLSVMESLAGPIPKGDVAALTSWDAAWRAKLRFIRARAMAEEAERIRKESEPKDHVWVDMVHPLFGTPEWKPYAEKHGFYVAGFEVGISGPGGLVVPPKTTGLSFSEALEAMKRGKKVKRKFWESCVAWIEGGAICMTFNTGNTARHISISNDEALAEDWEILP